MRAARVLASAVLLAAGCAGSERVARRPPPRPESMDQWSMAFDLPGGGATRQPPPGLPEVLVDRDNVEVTQSCRLRFTGPVADTDGNGVVHVTGAGAWVDLGGGTLEGTAEGTPPDRRAGTGIRVAADRVSLVNGSVRGFKVAVHLQDARFSQLDRLDLSFNYAPRLKSTPEREDESDWLRPQRNDAGEWVRDGGAAVWVDRGQALVRNVRVRGGQNGVVLDRTVNSWVVDCDCSFLSGWGVALWRSGACMIARNSLDFCVRGYSHGVYNRGQDSAGILCFEQCWGNVFALNSATHCGDGFFGFGGEESLDSDSAGGCRGNLLLANDFSFAVAHGMEMTFSLDNRFAGNRVEGAAICGLWGGYCQGSIAEGNEFIDCGDRGYGAERGGINIEHGQRWTIRDNRFAGGPMGIRLWWDEDPGLGARTWVRRNGNESRDFRIDGNRFEGLAVAIELAGTAAVAVGPNTFERCAAEVKADEASAVSHGTERSPPGRWQEPIDVPAAVACIPGSRAPIGTRRALGGREAIRIGEWGPVTAAQADAAPPAK